MGGREGVRERPRTCASDFSFLFSRHTRIPDGPPESGSGIPISSSSFLCTDVRGRKTSLGCSGDVGGGVVDRADSGGEQAGFDGRAERGTVKLACPLGPGGPRRRCYLPPAAASTCGLACEAACAVTAQAFFFFFLVAHRPRSRGRGRATGFGGASCRRAGARSNGTSRSESDPDSYRCRCQAGLPAVEIRSGPGLGQEIRANISSFPYTNPLQPLQFNIRQKTNKSLTGIASHTLRPTLSNDNEAIMGCEPG